jgi:hypothetical protein
MMCFFWELGMKKSLVVGASVLVLGGCALPVPLQVASWALDGLSYLATEKSLTDHGISMVAQKDCVIFRGITDGEVCRNWDDAATLVADAGHVAQSPQLVTKSPSVRIGYSTGVQSDIPPLSTELDDSLPNVEMLANFDTAAGSAETVDQEPSFATRPLKTIQAQPKPSMPIVAKRQKKRATPKALPVALKALPVTAMAELPIPPMRVTTSVRMAAVTSQEPVAGIYYVIGSFRNYANARGLAERYEGLVPEVLAAKLDGAPVFRVVVGPIAEGREKAVYRQVAHAGVRDSWAIRVVAGDWLLARQVIDRKRQIGRGLELARATN